MNERFTYPSRTRGTAVACVVCAGLCIASILVWQFTDWLSSGDSLSSEDAFLQRFTEWLGPGISVRGFAFCWWAVCFGALSRSFADGWFHPVVRECWLRDGVFGWRSPRRPRACGEAPLSEVRVLSTGGGEYFRLLTTHGQHNVPLECVQDIKTIADLIARVAPHIRV